MQKIKQTKVISDIKKKKSSSITKKTAVIKTINKTSRLTLNNFDKLTIVCGIFLVLLIMVIFGAYLGYFNNSATIFVTKIISAPAMFINGQKVSLDNYLSETKALKKYSERQGLTENLTELRQKLLPSLIKKYVIFDLAKKAGINVSNEELRAELSKLSINQNFNNANELTENLYGFNVENYGQMVLRPLILADKLEKYFYSGQNNQRLLSKMIKIKKDLNLKPEEFETFAKDTNEDQTRFVNGDLGWFNLNSMPPNFALAILNLKVGEISGVVSLNDGLHIFKLVEKIAADKEIRLHIAHIFIVRPSFADYLASEIKKARIWSWVNI